MPHKTEPDWLATYEEEAWYWINQYGMQCYEWCFQVDDEEDPDNRGSACLSREDGMAVLTLFTDWQNNVSEICEREVHKTAFHEVTEVWLWPTRETLEMAMPDPAVNAEIHRLIRTLENILWKPDYERRIK